MASAVFGHDLTVAQRPHLGVSQQALLALVCLCAGIAPFAAHWIPDDGARVACGLVLTIAYLASTLFARQHAALHQFWELALAFFVLAIVLVLNNSIPGYVGTSILHDPPNSGNPLASTISGTIVVQLLGTLIAIVPVILFTKVSGRDLGSIYVRKGVIGGSLVFSIIFSVLFYVFLATAPLRPDSPASRLLPTNSAVTLDRFLALTPALLVISFSNGFEEEFLTRCLFLQKYNVFFGARVSNVIQAMVFSTAHLQVTYTPSALFFIAVGVFPLGLAAGYLMRATKSVLTPGIFHGALDMAIYVAFLSYAS